MHDFDLVDIWREAYPHKPGFTWFSDVTLGICCRLDFFCVNRHLCNYISNISVLPSLCSDHSAISFHLSINLEKRGPGYWKSIHLF